MPEVVRFTVENKLFKAKRQLCVYRYRSQEADIISYGTQIRLELDSNGNSAEDYIHLSPVAGPGALCYETVIHIPLFFNIDITTEGQANLQRLDEYTVIRIPPGDALWKVKISLPAGIRATPQKQSIVITNP